MQGLTFIKTYLFRLLALVLLAVSAGLVVVPESNSYSADRTIVKSHVPTESFVLVLTEDDKEDIDEDGAIYVPLSPEFSTELVTLVAFLGDGTISTKPFSKVSNLDAYIFHRQLLI